jgi:SPP1 gp7 family putative phage head morphogenesis protein
LRGSYYRAIRRRFKGVAKDVKRYLIDEDGLGLKGIEVVRSLLTNVDPGDIGTDAGKVAAFRAWLKKTVDAGILEIEDGVDPETPWMSEFVTRGYKKGVTRGFDQVNAKRSVLQSEAFFAGSKLQWLRSAFSGEEAVSKLQLIATRSYTKLQGITSEMDAELTRILVEGLAAGTSVVKIANQMVERIDGFSDERARRLANTEIMYAHAEGQLDSFERMGIAEVNLQAEWLTAGDTRVCYRCQAMAGSRLSIAEARGLIPLHPNCRCIWIPYLL